MPLEGFSLHFGPICHGEKLVATMLATVMTVRGRAIQD